MLRTGEGPTVVRMNRAAFDEAREQRTGYCYGCAAEQHGVAPTDGPRARDAKLGGGPVCKRCGQQAVVGVERAQAEGWLIVEPDQVAA